MFVSSHIEIAICVSEHRDCDVCEFTYRDCHVCESTHRVSLHGSMALMYCRLFALVRLLVGDTYWSVTLLSTCRHAACEPVSAPLEQIKTIRVIPIDRNPLNCLLWLHVTILSRFFFRWADVETLPSCAISRFCLPWLRGLVVAEVIVVVVAHPAM